MKLDKTQWIFREIINIIADTLAIIKWLIIEFILTFKRYILYVLCYCRLSYKVTKQNNNDWLKRTLKYFIHSFQFT